jgi:hypothetical protein
VIKARPKQRKKARVYANTPSGRMRLDGRVKNSKSAFDGEKREERYQYLAERDMRRLSRMAPEERAHVEARDRSRRRARALERRSR